MKKTMDHIEYPKMLEEKNMSELLFIRKDAHEAMLANPDGINAGYYADEVNYVSNEINRRKGE